MGTATVEAPDRTRITFSSPHEQLVLTRVPEVMVPDALGQKHKRPGKSYKFDRGLLTVRVGQDKLADRYNEESGEFEEQDAVDWLRAHHRYGLTVIELPPIPPDPAPLMERVMQLAVKRDEEGLVDVYEAEREGYQRKAVLDLVVAALNQMDSEVKLAPPDPSKAAQGTGLTHKPVRSSDAPTDEPSPEDIAAGRAKPPEQSPGGFNPDAAEVVENPQPHSPSVEVDLPT